MSNMKIAAQLYTVRDYCRDEAGIIESLEKVAKIGYKYVQISGVADIDPHRMRELLDQNGLKCVVTHYGFPHYWNELDAMIEKHLILGSPNAGIGGLPSDDRDKKESYLKFAEQAEIVSRKFKENGMNFVYHNHSFEFVRFGDKTALELIYENAPSMQTELDLHWVVAGGGDPVQWIEKYAGRMNVIHYKDFGVNNKGERQYREIGEGNLNWAAINVAAEKAGVEYCIVEQDDTYGRDPFESLAISYKNLKAMGLQ